MGDMNIETLEHSSSLNKLKDGPLSFYRGGGLRFLGLADNFFKSNVFHCNENNFLQPF